MGMHLLIDKDSGGAIWINNSVDCYGCSCEFPSEFIAHAYMEWAICNYSATRLYKWAGTVDEIIKMGTDFINLISSCKTCNKDLETDEIDNVLIDLNLKRHQWSDFVMKCETCLEKEEEKECQE